MHLLTLLPLATALPLALTSPTPNCPPLTAPAALSALPKRSNPSGATIISSAAESLVNTDINDVLHRMAIVATNLKTTTTAINTLVPDADNTAAAGNIAEQAAVLSQHVRDVIATANASTHYTAAQSACQARANKFHFNLITEMTDAIVAKRQAWASALAGQDVSKTIHNAILIERNLVVGAGGFSEAVDAKSVKGTENQIRGMGPYLERQAKVFRECVGGSECLPALLPVLQAYAVPGVPFDTAPPANGGA